MKNHIDLLSMVFILPILAIEFWYWGQPVEKRPKRILQIGGGLLLGILIVLVIRHFTNWGDIFF